MSNGNHGQETLGSLNDLLSLNPLINQNGTPKKNCSALRPIKRLQGAQEQSRTKVYKTETSTISACDFLESHSQAIQKRPRSHDCLESVGF